MGGGVGVRVGWRVGVGTLPRVGEGREVAVGRGLRVSVGAAGGVDGDWQAVSTNPSSNTGQTLKRRADAGLSQCVRDSLGRPGVLAGRDADREACPNTTFIIPLSVGGEER